MFELILTRAEFLVLLDATLATKIVGLDTRELIPASSAEYEVLIEQGLHSFAERGLLHIDDDGVRTLDRRLYTLATVLAHPHVAVITSWDAPGASKQLLLHYHADQGTVEQTFPQPGEHRIAALPALPALFDRILEVLPVQRAAEVGAAVTLPQETFVSVKALLQAGQRAAATNLLSKGGLAAPAAALLIEALEQPVFSGTITLLQYEDQQISDTRELPLLQGPRATWLITQTRLPAAMTTIESISAGMLRDRLGCRFGKLAHRAELCTV